MDKATLANLKAFCRSERQTEILDAVIQSGGKIRKAATLLGVNHSQVSRAIKRIERHAALQGFSPDHDMTKVCPDTHYVKGTSTLYGEDGKPRLQWVKTNRKLADMLEDVRDFAEALGENVTPFEPVAAVDKGFTDDNLLTVYPLADIHFGMLAWSRETREDYDLAIARDAIGIAADVLTSKAPRSRQAIVANLGDFFHFDNNTYQTTSGNILDADGRWSKVIELGVECLLRFIRLALENHETVKVINSIGNHDGQSALMLPLILKPYFRNEPRVIIEDTPRLHHYHKFGANLLGFHHGHKTQPGRLPMTMVNDCMINPEFDSEGVEFCHWLTGHIHHETKEHEGILVESFRTLAAKDAYHAGNGYRAGRDIQTITYHKTFGEINRDRVSYKYIQFLSGLNETKTSTKRNP
jgi:hypothetical protein